MARGRERGVFNAGDWQLQQRAKALLQSAAHIPDLGNRPLDLWSQVMVALDALKEAMVTSFGNAAIAWEAVGEAVLTQLERCRTLDAKHHWNSAVLHWLLFLSWEDVRRCYPQHLLDDFPPAARRVVPSGLYGRIVAAMGWEPLLAEALLWVPDPADSAPRLLACLFDAVPNLAPLLLSTMLCPGPRTPTFMALARVLVAGTEAAAGSMRETATQNACLGSLARYVADGLRQRNEEGATAERDREQGSMPRQENNETEHAAARGADDGAGHKCHLVEDGGCWKAASQLLLDLLIQWGAPLLSGEGTVAGHSRKQLRSALEEVLAQSEVAASRLLEGRQGTFSWAAQQDEASFRVCCHLKTRLTLLGVQRAGPIPPPPAIPQPTTPMQHLQGSQQPATPLQPPQADQTTAAARSDLFLAPGLTPAWQSMLQVGRHNIPPSSLHVGRQPIPHSTPLGGRQTIPQSTLPVGSQSSTQSATPPPGQGNEGHFVLPPAAAPADTLPSGGDPGLRVAGSPDQAEAERLPGEVMETGSVEEGLCAQLLARGVPGLPPAYFGNGASVGRMKEVEGGGEAGWAASLDLLPFMGAVQTLSPYPGSAWLRSLNPAPLSPLWLAACLLHMLQHVATSPCAQLMAAGTWESLIKLTAGTVSLVADAGARRALLNQALAEAAHAPLGYSLDADEALQRAADSAVVATANRMATGDEAEVRVFGDEHARVTAAVGELLGPAMLAPVTTLHRLVATACRHKAQATLVAQTLREMPALVKYVPRGEACSALCLALSSAVAEAGARPRPAAAASALLGFVDCLLSCRQEGSGKGVLSREEVLEHVILPRLQTLVTKPSLDPNALLVTLRLLEPCGPPRTEHHSIRFPATLSAPGEPGGPQACTAPLLACLMKLADRHYRGVTAVGTPAGPDDIPAGPPGTASGPARLPPTVAALLLDAAARTVLAACASPQFCVVLLRRLGLQTPGGEGFNPSEGQALNPSEGESGAHGNSNDMEGGPCPSPRARGGDSTPLHLPPVAELTWRTRLLLLPVLAVASCGEADAEVVASLMPPSLPGREPTDSWRVRENAEHSVVTHQQQPEVDGGSGRKPQDVAAAHRKLAADGKLAPQKGLAPVGKLAHDGSPTHESDAAGNDSTQLRRGVAPGRKLEVMGKLPGDLGEAMLLRSKDTTSYSADSKGQGAVAGGTTSGSISPEDLLRDVFHFCSCSAACAEAFAATAMPGVCPEMPEGLEASQRPFDGKLSPKEDDLNRHVAHVLVEAIRGCSAREIRAGLVLACARVLPFCTAPEFERIVRVGMPTLLQYACGSMRKHYPSAGASQPTAAPALSGEAGLQLTVQLLCRAGYVLALAPQLVPLSNDDTLQGEDDGSRQDVLDVFLQHVAAFCARVTAEGPATGETGANGAAASSAVARRCLMEVCNLAAALRPAYSCSALEFLLLHLVKVVLGSGVGSKQEEGVKIVTVEGHTEGHPSRLTPQQTHETQDGGSGMFGRHVRVWVGELVAKVEEPVRARLDAAISKLAVV